MFIDNFLENVMTERLRAATSDTPVSVNETTMGDMVDNLWWDRKKQPSVEGAEMPRFQLASPYGPNLNEYGLDTTFAPMALHELRSRYEVVRGHPELAKGVIGMTVFGSMVKGGARKADETRYLSDVDAYVFIDTDEFGRQPIYDKPHEHVSPWVDKTDPNLKAINTILTAQDSEIKGEYLWSGFKYLAMNDAIVDRFIAEDVPRWLQGDFSFYGTCAQNVLAMFHMRVGSGKILSMRKRVVDGLNHTAGGEEIWQKIMDKLGKFEEGRRNATIYLPQTVQEGRDYFHANIVEGGALSIPSKADWVKTKLSKLVGTLGLIHKNPK